MELDGTGQNYKLQQLSYSLYLQADTCEVLLRAGCSRDARTKVDKTPLHVAAQEGHTEICELLLSQGADVDARDMVNIKDNVRTDNLF